MVRFKALQEGHIHIKPSWMCPLLGWFQSSTHLELPFNLSMSTRMGERGEEEGSERCREKK